MAKINKYWGYVAIGALTAAAAGAVAALIAKKGSCKEDFDFEDDFDDFDLTDEKETAKEDQEPAEDFQSWEHTGEQSTTGALFHVQVEQKIEREEAPKITGTNKDAEVEKKPYVRKGAKVGRNDPCPCGSGKKYKNCCGRNK